MKKGNLGNVALQVCYVCGKEMGVLMQRKEGKDIFEGKRQVCTGELCDKCLALTKANVSFVCHTCNSFHCVKLEAVQEMGLKVKAGDKYKVYKCPHCNNGAFEFLPPEK